MTPSRTIGLALLLSALVPFSVAEADNRIRTSSTRLDDEIFELRVEASEDIGEPRVRTSPGFVRIWFPAMDAPILNTASDGRSVRFVRIRPGYEDTAIAVIRLGDMRTLDPGEVVVTREGNVARIRVRRSALPPPILATPAEIAAPEALADAHASAELDAVAERDSAEGPVADAEGADAEPVPVPSEVAPQSVEEPLAALSTRSSAALPIPSSSGPSTLVMMLILTLLLGSAYLMVRLFGKYYGKRAGINPDIEIVATKRLGNRHQLLVVRALGEDYLLSVNGGHTEKIASSPTPLLSLNTEAEEDGEPESELLPLLKLGRNDEEGSSRRNRSVARKRIEVRPRFGAELLKAAGERTRSDRVSLSSTQAPASDAVAGLLRLRQKLGR